MTTRDLQGHRVLIAASLVSMVLGSIHAFSVLLVPLEAAFGAPRATVSLIYSAGLVFLTIAVLCGTPLYARLRPATLYLWVAGLGATGAVVAGAGGRLETIFLGYSLLFGVANGLGYGFGLQFAARANPGHAGFAMGVVTAAYALGAVLAPYGFKLALAVGGVPFAMYALAASVALIGISAAIMVAQSGARYEMDTATATAAPLPAARIVTIWIAYGSGVAAGLMAIGHAAGIAQIAGFSGWTAAAVIAGCNLIGSLLSGWVSDRLPHRHILLILAMLGATALAGLALLPALTLPLLGIVGFAYGGTIAAYPAAIGALFPKDAGPRIYGRVFTAWGAMGLLAPWCAGRIYDWSGDYSAALWLAALCGALSALMVRKAL